MSEFDEGRPVPVVLPEIGPVEVVGVIAAEQAQQCDDCGEIRELRPYGPGGSSVCFDCAMKDPTGTEQRAAQVMFGRSPDKDTQ